MSRTISWMILSEASLTNGACVALGGTHILHPSPFLPQATRDLSASLAGEMESQIGLRERRPRTSKIKLRGVIPSAVTQGATRRLSHYTKFIPAYRLFLLVQLLEAG
jgi:hypothetical protein